MFNFLVKEAKYIEDYKVWIKFNDNKAGVINLEKELHGKVFEPLNDINYFKNFIINGHTLAWKNGADFVPEYLYKLITKSF